jgi:hypothetical protein
MGFLKILFGCSNVKEKCGIPSLRKKVKLLSRRENAECEVEKGQQAQRFETPKTEFWM